MMTETTIIAVSVLTLTALHIYKTFRDNKDRNSLRVLRDKIKARDDVFVEIGSHLHLMTVTGLLHEKGTKNGSKFTEKKVIVRDQNGNVTAIPLDRVYPKEYMRK
jgi:hypothetical protein